MDDRFTLRTEWEAYFNMSLVNGGFNGAMVSMTVLGQWGVDLQFDDCGGSGVSASTSNAMKYILQWRIQFKKANFDRIPEGEVVWRPDDRCMEPGPARGFLAFQKRTRGRVVELLCMAMKKEWKEDAEDETFTMPAVLCVRQWHEPENSEHTLLAVSSKEWTSLCYLMVEMRKESLAQASSKKVSPPTLSEALRNPEAHFLTTLLPANVAAIELVFGI